MTLLPIISINSPNDEKYCNLHGKVCHALQDDKQSTAYHNAVNVLASHVAEDYVRDEDWEEFDHTHEEILIDMQLRSLPKLPFGDC